MTLSASRSLPTAGGEGKAWAFDGLAGVGLILLGAGGTAVTMRRWRPFIVGD